VFKGEEDAIEEAEGDKVNILAEGLKELAELTEAKEDGLREGDAEGLSEGRGEVEAVKLRTVEGVRLEVGESVTVVHGDGEVLKDLAEERVVQEVKLGDGETDGLPLQVSVIVEVREAREVGLRLRLRETLIVEV